MLINRAAFKHNLRRVRQLTPQSGIMAVIKADAYGHGMEVAATALEAVDEFAVNGLDDVLRLRNHGVSKRITTLSAVLHKVSLETLADLNVRPVIFDHSQIEIFAQMSSARPLSVWLKVDTGMGRLGIAPAEVAAVLERLRKLPSIADISLMTHLANADQPNHPSNQQQISIFSELGKQFHFHQLSVLNSAGTIALSDAAHGSGFDLVRPGLMLYGASPLLQVAASEIALQPVMTLKSQLISVKTLPGGSMIGYGSTYELAQATPVGIVACGYGDGYPRHAPSGTPVLVNDQQVKLIGRVSMDMLAVDLSGVTAQTGDEVVLWGEHNPIEDIAAAAGTIAYELCCGITARVERILI